MNVDANTRCLPFNVFRWSLGECSNGGVTATESTIYILCPDGHYTIGELRASNRGHLIFRPEKRGENYWAAIPLEQPTGKVGPMMGGTLAATSDSRSKSIIYNVHDRFETAEQYAALSV